MDLVVDKSLTIEERELFLKVFKLHQGYMFLISDNPKMGFGEISLGIPSSISGISSTSSSFNLFGLKFKMISKIIIESVAKRLNSPVLLLFHVKAQFKEEHLIEVLMQFLKNIIDELKEKN
jgi:hypothetical protein